MNVLARKRSLNEEWKMKGLCFDSQRGNSVLFELPCLRDAARQPSKKWTGIFERVNHHHLLSHYKSAV